MTFQFAIVPCTYSPLIRDMHRHVIEIAAPDLRAAKALVEQAFPDGADLTGEWFVEKGSLVAA